MSKWYRRDHARAAVSLFGPAFYAFEYFAHLKSGLLCQLTSCKDEWYDVRNWLSLMLLPVAIIVAPFIIVKHFRTQKQNVINDNYGSSFGITVNSIRNQRLIESAVNHDHN